MILATPRGDVQPRAAGMFAGESTIPTPAEGVGTGAWSIAGRRVTPQIAAGLPAILRGVRLLGETVAAMPLGVVKTDANGDHEQAVGSWQYEVLHDTPNDTQKTPFAFKEFVVASMVAMGNSYSLKAKSRGRVQALYPLKPSRVRPKYPKGGGPLEYEIREDNGRIVTLTADDVLHIPGVLFDDPCIGISPIMLAANTLGTAISAEEFAGRFFDNDATPSGVISFKQGGDSKAAKDTRETWEDRHRGSRRSHKVAALFGEATYQQIGVNAEQAQIIESQRWSVDQAARVLGLPAWALGGVDQNPRSTPEQRNSELLTFSISAWIKRFEEGLHADPDMFPDKSLFPFFETEGLVRAEMSLRYESYLKARQGGWQSANDIRRKENEPPIEGGDVYQETPVGGAPALQPGADEGPPPDDPTKAKDVPPVREDTSEQEQQPLPMPAYGVPSKGQ